MKDEIKEILDNLEDAGFMYKRISPEEIKKILDYITNLQKSQETLIKNDNEIITNLQEENKELKEINKEQANHLISKDNLSYEDYKLRNEKAIEYIKDRLEEGCLDKLNYYDLHKIENILQGEDK